MEIQKHSIETSPQDFDKLDVLAFYSIIKDRIVKRWYKDFPEYVIIETTKNKQEHKICLEAPRRFFNNILNGINRADYTKVGFKIEDYHKTVEGINIGGERRRLINTIETCPDLRIWLIEAIGG